jgi:hypothetical protein
MLFLRDSLRLLILLLLLERKSLQLCVNHTANRGDYTMLEQKVLCDEVQCGVKN